MTSRSVRVAAVVFAVALCLVPHPAAQEPPGTQGEGQPPTFRGGIDSISVDVIVTDEQGQPVTDLTAEDFEIREEGKAQSVQTFRFVQLDDGWDDRATKHRSQLPAFSGESLVH